MKEAYKCKSADKARKRLQALVSWLERNGYDEAAGSLREGMEETLTVVKLALPALLRQSLATTNAIGFRRKRFSAARALRERHRLRANAMASRTIDRIFQNSRKSEPLHVPKTPVASSGRPERSSRAWQV